MMSGAVNAIFLDTNILVYATIVASPFHQQARTAIQTHATAGTELWISRQVLREYLTPVTRPQFIQPLPVTTAIADVTYFQTRFRIAEDGPTVMSELLSLIQQVTIAGRQIHDANIVATMRTYSIDHLLTHNTADFNRFAQFITVIPL